MLITATASPSFFQDLKNGFLSEMAVWILLVFVLAYYHFPVLAGKDPTGSGFCGYAAGHESDERKVSEGEWRQVYDPISEIWNGTRPIYLPAMWFPYAPAVMLKIDMRWITVTAVFD